MSEYFTIESDRLRIIKGEGWLNTFLTKRIVDEMFETMDTIKTIGGQVSSEMLSQILNKSYFIEIGGDICFIEDEAFNLNDSIEKVRLKSSHNYSGLFTIGDMAFCGCSKLKTLEIDLPSSIVDFGNKSFGRCFNLNNVDITCKHVQLKSSYAFLSCKSLKNIRLPSVSVLGKENFYGCESLDSIYIPRNSVDKIQDISSLNSGTKAKIILYDEFNEHVMVDKANVSELQSTEEPENTEASENIIIPQTAKSIIKSYNGVIRPNIIANKKNRKS